MKKDADHKIDKSVLDACNNLEIEIEKSRLANNPDCPTIMKGASNVMKQIPCALVDYWNFVFRYDFKK